MPCQVLKIFVRKLKIEQQELHQKRGLTHVLWTGYEFLAAPLVKSVVQLNFDNIHSEVISIVIRNLTNMVL